MVVAPEQKIREKYVKDHKLKVKHINETLEQVVTRRLKAEYLAQRATEREARKLARMERTKLGIKRKK